MSRIAARARAGEDRTSLYDEITDKIIAELEAGRVPWVQPWGTAAAKAPLAMPKNASTGRALFRDQCPDPVGRRHRARLLRPELAHLPAGARPRRQCPQGRARHHRRLCRPLHARGREAARRQRAARKPGPFRSSSASPSSTPTNATVCRRTSRRPRRRRRPA